MNARTNWKGGRLLSTVAATALLLALLAGWALTSGEAVHQPQAGSATAPMSDAKPVSIDIPRIGARSSLVELGLGEDKTLAVPPVSQPMQAGWYGGGPTPGERGPAVIAGHVDGGGQKGIFYRLDDLRAGDVIDIQREDGTTAEFGVQRVEQVPKSNFPSEEVYGSTPDAQLRLITCGGPFDSATHSYRDNVIVFANLLRAG